MSDDLDPRGRDDPRSDAQLLAATRTEPQAFAIFYRRHARLVLAVAARRLNNAELAADVTSETFAAALEHCDRFDSERAGARAWLLGILAHQIASAQRRGAAESRARRRLGMEPIELADDQRSWIEALADRDEAEVARALLAELPESDRALLQGRVVEGRRYAQLAQEFGLPEPVLRKRVSRGLAVLRTRFHAREAMQ